MKGSRLVKSQFCNGNNVVAKRKHDVMQCSLHGHDFYELDIVLGGCAKAVLNGRSLVAKAGTVFFLSPEDFHEYPTDSPLDIYNVQFTNEAVSVDLLRRVMDSQNRIYVLTEDSFEGVRRLCAMMQELSVGAELLSHLLEGILLFLCCNRRTESHLPADRDSMQKVIAYLHEHFRENPSLGEAANLLHLNQRYFCKKFRDYTGQTYKAYLKGIKLRYARRLLLVTSLSVMEIAEQSGYETQSHFNREFREYYHITPMSLRKEKNEGDYNEREDRTW